MVAWWFESIEVDFLSSNLVLLLPASRKRITTEEPLFKCALSSHCSAKADIKCCLSTNDIGVAFDDV